MTTSQPGRFDFLIGEWAVTNRRLLRPLTGGGEWDEFPGEAICRGPLFDGAANLDEIVFPTKGFRGLTLRLYRPETDDWVLNWVNNRDGRLTPPVAGRFGADGRGEFHGDDLLDGEIVRCRFVWSGIEPGSARWEQAYATPDGGWETNWIMQFRRTA